MSMVNADSVQLFAMLKKMQDSISSIETTKKSVKMKYEQLGAGWQDKKYNELGVVVRDCNKALNDILVIMLQAEKYVALLAKSLSEYESVQLGSTNGISASTPQTSSFAVTPSSADTTTFESNTFGSNLAFVQDRLSAERYFSRGNHYEEYRDYWENGNYTFSRNENPELVYVRARDIAHFFEASMGDQGKLELLANFFPTAFGIFSSMIDSIRPDNHVRVLSRER